MLDFNALSFWYDLALPPAIYQFNLEVCDGEFLAVVGVSGGGKSTLLRLGCGLLQLEKRRNPELPYRVSGSVQYDRAAVEAPLSVFGHVAQAFMDALLPHLNARENVLVAARADGLSDEERARANDLMATCGIIDVANVNVRKLSGGQQQRVAICRALITGPRVLFMDEPFANLDPSLKPRIGELLCKIRERNPLTVFLVTHDVQGAVALADRVLCLRPGYAIPRFRVWSRAQADVATIENWMMGDGDEPHAAIGEVPPILGDGHSGHGVPDLLGDGSAPERPRSR